MINYWKSLSFTTKFSSIAFFVTGFSGLFSMGILGFGLYFPVSFLFSDYLAIEKWHGDWTWPAFIGAGMLWSVGFVLAGIAWHYVSKRIQLKALLILLYIFILWLWNALVWYILISSNLEPYA